MKRYRFAAAFLVFALVYAPVAMSGELSDDLVQQISQSKPGDMVSVWIKVHSPESRSQFKAMVNGRSALAAERHRVGVNRLKTDSRQSQAGVVQKLDELKANGKANKIESFWIANVVQADVAADELELLAARPDVEIIYEVPGPSLIEPVEERTISRAALEADSVTSNIHYVRADEAHTMGYTGKGRLVCSFDTGVDGAHPALYSRWKGLDGDSAAAWFDPVFHEKFPHKITNCGYSQCNSTHGTHTMGIMVGRDASIGYTTGVAPEAQWISAAVIDVAGGSILEAFQWAADPDGDPNTADDVPDVINHSWGYDKGALACENVFFDAIDNIEALGIVNIFAAGNTGAIGFIYNPANRAQTDVDCFAVGNLNTTVSPPLIAGTSSRGPTDCLPNNSYKPNVVAPGSAIISTYPNNLYGVMSGTSMAAPHVSGLVALLRQKNPNATVDEVKEAIRSATQVDGGWGTVPSNTYGWGAIDCVAALNALSSTNALPNVRMYDFTHAPISPGDIVTGTVVLRNTGASVTGVSGVLSGLNPSLNVLTGGASFGDIGEGDTVRSSNAISVAVSDTVTPGSILSLDFDIVGNGGGYSKTLTLSFLVEPPGARSLATHTTSALEFSISNYGVLGLGPASLFSGGGVGFDVAGGGNDIWEAGVLMGNAWDRVSSGVHSYVDAPNMDFGIAPDGNMQFYSMGVGEAQESMSAFSDYNAANPLGIIVEQHSFSYPAPNSDFVVLGYVLKNPTGATVSNLYFGLFFDWDIPASFYDQDAGGYESVDQFGWMAYNSGSTTTPVLSQFRGIRLIKGSLASVQTGISNNIVYIKYFGGNGYTMAEKWTSLTTGLGTANTYKSAQNDLFQVVSAGPMTIPAGEADTIAFALMEANTLSGMHDVAQRAINIATDVDDGDPGDDILPSSFALYQNYPNPFNPSTTISFDLPRAADYRVVVYNVLGQEVHAVNGDGAAGRVEIEWKPENAATGIYLYKVTAGDWTATRKMLLLK